MVDQGRSAIGGDQGGNTTASSGTTGINYGVMPEQLTQQFQAGSNAGEFILIHKPRQGDQATVWSSGDQDQTKTLFREVAQYVPDMELTT